MSLPTKILTITGATPASATTAVVGLAIPAEADNIVLGAYESLTMQASLTGGTGGTLDVYVQRSFDGGTTWRDYWHVTQVAAGATKHFDCSPTLDSSTYEVGQATTPALAAGQCAGGKWGQMLRVIATGGAGTTVAGSATVKFVFGRNERRS
jgi:hypothetical protein